MYINCKEGKKNIVYINGGHVIAAVSIQKSNLTMEETLTNKRILKELTREGKSLAFYTPTNKLKP
jgi:hypothetical protein